MGVLSCDEKDKSERILSICALLGSSAHIHIFNIRMCMSMCVTRTEMTDESKINLFMNKSI